MECCTGGRTTDVNNISHEICREPLGKQKHLHCQKVAWPRKTEVRQKHCGQDIAAAYRCSKFGETLTQNKKTVSSQQSTTLQNYDSHKNDCCRSKICGMAFQKRGALKNFWGH